MSGVKKLCVCAMCVALCGVLPAAVHYFAVDLAAALSPMHFPVLLCGLVCGWAYGGVCGVLGPLLSMLVSGRPMPPGLFFMTAELITYGVVTGVLMKRVRTGHTLLDIYLALLPAMVLGRIVGGVVQALVLGNDFFAFFISSYFIGTAPGILIQLIILPGIYLALMKGRLIPPRYSSKVVQ